MPEIVRVARDNSAVIYRVADGYTRVTVETKKSDFRPSLAELAVDGAWRRPVSKDKEVFKDVEVKSSRRMRLPENVLTALSTASESGIFSEQDTKRIADLVQRKTATGEDAKWIQDRLDTFSTTVNKISEFNVSSWTKKVAPLTAAGFEISDELDYFGVGDDEDTEEITGLIALTEEDTLLSWDGEQFNELDETMHEYDKAFVIELDDDSAKQIAEWISAGAEGSFILDEVDELELTLFELAESELDLGFLSTLDSIVADATGYSKLERSRNAQVQRRGPGGTFAPGGKANITPLPQENRSRKLSQYHRARLKFILPLILDPDTSLKEWIAANPALWNVKSSRYDLNKGMKAAGEPVEGAEESEPGTPSTSSLYFAIVDPDDHEAVFDVVAIQGDEGGSPMAWKRQGGKWVDAPDMLADFRGESPPPVVQLNDDETVKDVLEQIDAHDAENPPEEEEAVAASAVPRTGFALPDGSFLIEDEEDLAVAIKSYQESDLDSIEVRNHIRKRARALNRADLIPAEWEETEITDLTSISASASPLYGPYGETYSLVAAGIPGVADTPGDFANVRRLKEYWKVGKGAAKIRWGSEGDLTRCHRNLSKYMPGQAWGYCQNIHMELFGMSNYEKDN